jgi:hypothetical protein
MATSKRAVPSFWLLLSMTVIALALEVQWGKRDVRLAPPLAADTRALNVVTRTIATSLTFVSATHRFR